MNEKQSKEKVSIQNNTQESAVLEKKKMSGKKQSKQEKKNKRSKQKDAKEDNTKEPTVEEKVAHDLRQSMKAAGFLDMSVTTLQSLFPVDECQSESNEFETIAENLRTVLINGGHDFVLKVLSSALRSGVRKHVVLFFLHVFHRCKKIPISSADKEDTLAWLEEEGSFFDHEMFSRFATEFEIEEVLSDDAMLTRLRRWLTGNKDGKMKRAVLLLKEFDLESHFTPEEVLKPLIACNDVNIATKYVGTDAEKQLTFVNMVQKSGNLTLAARMIHKFKLNPSDFPDLLREQQKRAFVRFVQKMGDDLCGTLKHLGCLESISNGTSSKSDAKELIGCCIKNGSMGNMVTVLDLAEENPDLKKVLFQKLEHYIMSSKKSKKRPKVPPVVWTSLHQHCTHAMQLLVSTKSPQAKTWHANSEVDSLFGESEIITQTSQIGEKRTSHNDEDKPSKVGEDTTPQKASHIGEENLLESVPHDGKSEVSEDVCSLLLTRLKSTPLFSYLTLAQTPTKDLSNVFVVDSPETLLRAEKLLLEEDVESVGLDCEWKASFSGALPSRVALLQIGSDTTTCLFDMLRTDESLWNGFLERLWLSDVIKLGFGFDGDLKELRKSFPSASCFKFAVGEDHKSPNVKTIHNFLDLSRTHQLVSVDDGKKARHGLAELVNIVLKKPLRKQMQVSNWNRRPLRDEQKEYAALDVVSLVMIFEELKKTHGSDWKAWFDVEEVEPLTELVEAVQLTPPISAKKNSDHELHGDIKFAIDTTLGRLARKLRCRGVDALSVCTHDEEHYGRAVPDRYEKLVQISKDQDRVILSRDYRQVQLLQKRNDDVVYHCVTSNDPKTQLFEVLNAFSIELDSSKVFSRCVVCNTMLTEAPSKEAAMDTLSEIDDVEQVLGVKAKVLAKVDGPLWQCSECLHVYWRGSHYRSILHELTTGEYTEDVRDADGHLDESKSEMETIG